MQKQYIYFLVFSALIIIGVVQTPKFRFSLLQSAKELDDPNIFYHLGDHYAKGRGIEQNLKQAEFWFLKAARHNHAKAMYKLGNLYSHRHGIQKVREVEEEYWQDVPLDLQKAIKWYLYAAELGSLDACVRLGYMNRQGVGMPINYKESLAWYKKAAKAGDKRSAAWLGYFYSHGLEREDWWRENPECWIDIEKNYSKAFKWYLKAAKSGHMNAQYMVGFMYSRNAMNIEDPAFFNTPKIPIDYPIAVYWYTEAAKQGSLPAYRKLGLLHRYGGFSLEKNYKKSFNYYMKGAKRGDFVCMRKLAYCYEDGVGVQQDTNIAASWYSKAITNGDTFSKELIERRQNKRNTFIF